MQRLSPLQNDRRLMAAALALSRRALGRTRPNPAVGALIVQEDARGRQIVVGQGVTQPAGQSHAEIVALREAGDKARGATAYVTLEPCAHYGRTGPCARALVAAGVARVVFAVGDPNPAVCGKGRQILEEGGVQVTRGVLKQECSEVLGGHLAREVHSRPFVQLKMAISRDGFIGRHGDGQVAVSGPLSKRYVHALRAQADAIVVGVGTVIADDPSLTCRLPGMEVFSPLRVVFDSQARLPLDSQLVRSLDTHPVMAIVGDHAPADRVGALERAGVDVVVSDCRVGERLCLDEALKSLKMMGLTRLMVEGGAQLARSFLDEGLVDEALILRGPHDIAADRPASGIEPFGGDGLLPLTAGYHGVPLRRIGEDRLWRYTRKA
ncbi:bifunctional diaminohydroxyphosphoribosylaminopyrimidine deaminase/5-amino-6-(5-phosphoribosylamino)uracil reductase RibD [Polycladidibacter hongkongensis]|uniref:bifunctional diaminohydroxyphosphoribosylaminopyrimidine deaminase/5-amino-6-(5-phosphoribosylamino)uracil reductase RibD n=1 Tax=Polycladidibacter hongkongensis TaxID=1647556 RepID=UPI000AA4BA06|nr:bifunctional diaminohydroxyphosphoribosylaminopyrimidine deaminase/5-amino-6-(5-phosphoribosylamino)uracil reductase RibD [Pseudovibrio hongkongensis]